MKSALCILLLSICHVSSINYYFVCSLPIHKISALCGIFSTICVLLTMDDSDGLEILVPDGLNSLRVAPVNSSCVISY